MFSLALSDYCRRQTGTSLSAIAQWSGLGAGRGASSPGMNPSAPVGGIFFGNLILGEMALGQRDRNLERRSEAIRNIQSGWYRHPAIPT